MRCRRYKARPYLPCKRQPLTDCRYPYNSLDPGILLPLLTPMEFTLFKKGPAPGRRRTDRFPNCSELEVSKDDHEGEPVIIQFGEGLGNPISAKAVKIKARPGDALERTWFDKDKPVSIPTVLFAFIDISALKNAYKNYVDKASLDIEFFRKVFANDVVVLKLFEEAMSMCEDEKVVSFDSTVSCSY